MASYATLLEKTRVPQPSIQRLAVISVFSKFRSAPHSESETGREAISFCLASESITVVDQSVRELCRLVSDSALDLSRGLLELQSALEGCDSKLVPIFVKGLGFLIRIGYERKHGDWKFNSTENHPFVRVCDPLLEKSSSRFSKDFECFLLVVVVCYRFCLAEWRRRRSFFTKYHSS